jgi:hypothetical protein
MLTLMQVRRGELPPWYLLAHGLRWGLPLMLGIGRTFTTADPVVLEPSSLAKTAGAAQVALSLSAILASMRADHPDAHVWTPMRKAFLMLASGLLGATTFVHTSRLLGTLTTSNEG